VDTISIRTTTPEVTPSGAARAERALVLFGERGDEIRRIGGETYSVPSCSGRGFYRVRYGGFEESCECPDFQIPRRGRKLGEPCKHLLAVGIMHAPRRRGSGEPYLLRGRSTLRGVLARLRRRGALRYL
jgi:hypothetical protein